jgi:hypothetical protein
MYTGDPYADDLFAATRQVLAFVEIRAVIT